MQQIKMPTFFGIIMASLLLFTACGEPKSQNATPEISDNSKPNIIIVMTDDQGYGDLSYHGNPYIKTPNLDKFAADALEFTNFHVGTTCTPTRAGLMTGRNANRNNAWHTIAGCSILLEEEELMPEVFARNGYATAMFGKWHLGDNYPFRPQDRGFQNAFYHGGGGIQQTPDYWNNDYFDDTYFRNGKPEKSEGYCTDVWFKEASEFIKKKGDRPFFMYIAPNAAHGPFNVPEAYAKKYDTMPLTAIQKRFYGMVSNIDDNFGKLVQVLREEGLFEDTIVIFTTDNGTARGISYIEEDDSYLGYNAGLRGTKGSHYDGGHKVPFFLSWPKGEILSQTSNDALVAHVDLLPTLAELAKISYNPKNPLDGTSIASIIKGKAKSLDRMLVIDTQRNQLPEKGRNSCVMSGAWRLIDGTQLYNTANDPGQKKDLALEFPERKEEMQQFYDAWWTSIEPDIRYAEIPIGRAEANPVQLTIHDMHTADNLPWNQVQIRKGLLSPEGYYSIRVEEEGNYRFKLYRYPPESGLSLNGVAEAAAGTPYKDVLPMGKALSFVSAEVRINDILLKASLDPNQNYAVLEGRLPKGSYHLNSYFLGSDGNQIPSNYTQITKF